VSKKKECKRLTDDKKSRQLLDDPEDGSHRGFNSFRGCSLKKRLRPDRAKKCMARKGWERTLMVCEFCQVMPSFNVLNGRRPRVQQKGIGIANWLNNWQAANRHSVERMMGA
jgi:hypothetical protein